MGASYTRVNSATVVLQILCRWLFPLVRAQYLLIYLLWSAYNYLDVDYIRVRAILGWELYLGVSYTGVTAIFERELHSGASYIRVRATLVYELYSGASYTLANSAAVVLQVLCGRPLLPVREQDPVRVRLRGATRVRQHGVQPSQPRPYQATPAAAPGTTLAPSPLLLVQSPGSVANPETL